MWWQYVRYFAIFEGIVLLYLLVTYLPPNVKYGMLFLFTVFEVIYMGFKSDKTGTPRLDHWYLWYGSPLALLVFTVALVVIYVRSKPV